MSYTGSRGFVEVFDDFDHDSIGTSAGDGITWFNSSDAGNTAFAQNAGVVGGEGTAQAATDTTDDDMCELAHGSLMWYGHLDAMMEVRMQMDIVTNVAWNVGFNDDALEDSNTLPVELATASWTTNSTTWTGFVYDVDATNKQIYAFWVDDDNDSSQAIGDLRFKTAAPVAATYGMFHLALYRGTSATSGVISEYTVQPDETVEASYQKRFSNTIDGNSAQTPHIGFENRSGTAHQCDIDYILVRQRRNQD